MTPNKFKGPLFIVGEPRSGTKLLRELLNRSPMIGIPVVESHFIPGILKQFGTRWPADRSIDFDRFYSCFSQTTFFGNLKDKGFFLDRAAFDRIPKTSWDSFLGGIFRFYVPQEKKNQDFIWGDKTPGYHVRMPLLKEAFPKAKFIHIVRDPRDVALSVWKTWGKNFYRTADRWRRRVEVAAEDGNKLGSDYTEVLYEDLLASPEAVLKRLCGFVGCEYASDMIRLARPAERRGAAGLSVEVLRSNTRKYLSELPTPVVKRIEEIVYPAAKRFHYSTAARIHFKPLGTVESQFFKLCDGISYCRSQIFKRGWRKGLEYACRIFAERHQAILK